MPQSPLQICQAEIERLYREKLGQSFSSSIRDAQSKPVWRFVSAEDLISPAVAEKPNAAGLLLDPEIGLVFYILPFESKTAVADMRKQILHALSIRSKLSTERNYTGKLTDKVDPNGAWRVVLHWLVLGGQLRDSWEKQIMKVRAETAFSEEVCFDAIFVDGTDVVEQLRQHGFSRLLLTTRHVFRKTQFDQVNRWMSANELVAEAMNDFDSSFRDVTQRGFAKDLRDAARTYKTASRRDPGSFIPPDSPRQLNKIHVLNFRNIRDATFEFGPRAVDARVVYGPNGTGKSSICEALSLALFSSSFRYKAFSDRTFETDVSSRNRSRYLEDYLTPLDEPSATPQISLNGDALRAPALASPEDVSRIHLEMSGTILTQSASQEFARMSSSDLGALILRDYSDLADYIDGLADSRFEQANTARQEFLRDLGLSAAITRLETAYARIAARTIDQNLPALPNLLMTWLESIGDVDGGRASNLATKWRDWGDRAAREQLAADIGSDLERTSAQRKLRQWLERFNELALQTADLQRIIKERVDSAGNELPTAAERIDVWARWLKERRQPVGTTAEVTKLTKRLEGLQKDEQTTRRKGQEIRQQLDHLTQAEAFIQTAWSSEHPNECPTCGADHSNHGGILAVVKTLRQEITEEREKLITIYEGLKSKIGETQKKLAELGQSQCPLSPDEQSRLGEAVSWLLPTSVPLATQITDDHARQILVTRISAVIEVPSAPASVAADTETERVVQIVLSKFAEARATFEAPNNWKPIRDKLKNTLTTIIQQHLPGTLGELWFELTMNLTAAPWLLPSRPCVDIVSTRGEQRASIQIKGRLARYLLNESEIHILGLAWFFARYLTHGRFFNACIIMDDPAQELDQTSFRELCRLWETWVRLHKCYERHLKLVLMLNQESRALDAARATGGILAMLGWTSDQDESIREINVIGEGFFPPQPEQVFGKLTA